MGIASVAVYSDADRFTRPVLEADEAVRLGAGRAAGRATSTSTRWSRPAWPPGAEAVHPGYGFLSENVRFAERLAEAGIVFIGPRPEHLRAFGLKHTAREIARASGVPLLPGTGVLPDVGAALVEAERIGYPVMLKSSAGGGGIGMQFCADAEQLRARFDSVQRTAQASFGDAARVSRAVRGRRTPCRGADLRRRQGPRGGARRTRLFAAAAQPEGPRGDARTRPVGRRRAGLHAAAVALGAAGELRLRRHGRVHL